LQAANGTTIHTYGRRTINLNLGFGRFSWEFILADVSQPLLGADFLAHHALLVDCKNQRLIHAHTYESVSLCRSSVQVIGVNALHTIPNDYAQLLS